MNRKEWDELPIGTVMYCGGDLAILRIKINKCRVMVINRVPGDYYNIGAIIIPWPHYYRVAPKWIAEKFEVTK